MTDVTVSRPVLSIGRKPLSVEVYKNKIGWVEPKSASPTIDMRNCDTSARTSNGHGKFPAERPRTQESILEVKGKRAGHHKIELADKAGDRPAKPPSKAPRGPRPFVAPYQTTPDERRQALNRWCARIAKEVAGNTKPSPSATRLWRL